MAMPVNFAPGLDPASTPDIAMRSRPALDATVAPKADSALYASMLPDTALEAPTVSAAGVICLRLLYSGISVAILI